MMLDASDDKSHLSFLSNENDMPEIAESRIEEKPPANTGGDMRGDPDAMAAALAAQREKNKAKAAAKAAAAAKEAEGGDSGDVPAINV